MTTLARATGTWRKSSRSNNGNNGCVELAWYADGRGIRDSKQDDDGPVLHFPGGAVASFLGWVKDNRH